jgi:hypothetical protein
VNDVFNRQNAKYISQFDQPLASFITVDYTVPKANLGGGSAGKAASWLLRDWTIGALLQYRSGLPIQSPTATNVLATGAPYFQSTFMDRVPGVPLFTQDLNCHCFDPNATFVLNPNAWANPAAGQFGSSAAYYSDYRTQRRPQENLNFGREWRVKERYKVAVRMEFTNILNRAYIGNPTPTNAQATQTRIANGNTASGFGYINTQSLTPQVAPRSGTLVARFSF